MCHFLSGSKRRSDALSMKPSQRQTPSRSMSLGRDPRLLQFQSRFGKQEKDREKTGKKQEGGRERGKEGGREEEKRLSPLTGSFLSKDRYSVPWTLGQKIPPL